MFAVLRRLAVGVVALTLILTVFGPANAAHAAGGTTVTATLMYMDRSIASGTPTPSVAKPIRNAEVEVWRFRPGFGGWGWSHDFDVRTDYNGFFSVTYPYIGEGILYALRVKATNDAVVVWPYDTQHTFPFYTGPGPQGSDIQRRVTAPDQTLDFSYTFEDEWRAHHFNIADTMLYGRDYAAARRNPGSTDALTRVNAQTNGGPTMFFNPLIDTVVIRPTQVWNDSALLHEYGHVVEARIGSFPWILSFHGGCVATDMLGTPFNSATHGWMEGFADYFAQAVRDAYPAAMLESSTLTSGGTPPIEVLESWGCAANPDNPSPAATERYIAGVLWDLHDATNEFDDRLAGFDTEIMQLVDGELDADYPTLQRFRDAWAARGLPLVELDRIFAINRVPTAWPGAGEGSYISTTDGGMYHIVGGAAVPVYASGVNSGLPCVFKTATNLACPIVRAQSVAMFGTVPPDGSPIIGGFDARIQSPGRVYAWGWAFDPDMPLAQVTVSVFRRSGTSTIELARLVANSPHPGVGVVYGEAGPNHGFSKVLSLRTGTYELCASAASTTRVPQPAPFGCKAIRVR